MDLKNYIVTIVSTVVLNEILLMILPDGNMKKYIKVVCAIVILIIIITPFVGLLTGSAPTVQIQNILNGFNQSYIEKTDIDIYQNYVNTIFERNSGPE
ncbi:MAG: stage III sporulation protein AF [Eubacteriales bacterium]